jgi:hypothetical protein
LDSSFVNSLEFKSLIFFPPYFKYMPSLYPKWIIPIYDIYNW